MNRTVLQTFLDEDGDPEARRKLLDAIRAPGTAVTMEFAFNRFNISLDFQARQVTIEDDLMMEEEWKQRIGFEEFQVALQK